MKKRLLITIILATLFTCFLAIGVGAVTDEVIDSGECGDNLTWKLYDDGELVIGGKGEMMSSPWRDSYSSQIKTVTIKDSVTSIYNYAFSDCLNLTSMSIGDSVTCIYDYAFSNCWNLTSISIGGGVTCIGEWAFHSCGSLTNVIIPDNVTTIGNHAFRHCDSLSSVTIGNGVTTIGNYSFQHCDSLTSIAIPDSVKSIGKSAFRNCTGLTSVTIGSGVTTIGEWAFQHCDSLTSIAVDTNNANYSSDEYGVLFNKHRTTLVQYPIGNKRTEYAIPEGVTTIGYEAFRNCTSLTSVTIGNSVTTLGKASFYECENLTKATIYSSEAAFSSYVFENTATNFEIHGYTDSTAEAYAFTNGHPFVSLDKGYTSGKCGDNLTWTLYDDGELVIDGTGAMTSSPWGSYSSQIKTVTIKDGVTTIANYAFSYCTSLTSVNIPDSVTTIGYGAFSYCKSLTSVNIPDSVTSIGDDAFYNCKSLTSVTIGSSVIGIDICAFEGCSNLTKATIYSRNTKFSPYVFRGTSADFEIYGYAGSTAEAYASANGHKFVALPAVSLTPTTSNSALAPDTQILAITAEENDTTYSMGDVNFYWSPRYKTYLAIVGDDVTEADVTSLLTATDGADPDVIAYDGDVNGDGKVTAGDAALVARLLASPDIDGCTDLMRFEADAYASADDNGYTVTLDDVKAILYAAVGLTYNG